MVSASVAIFRDGREGRGALYRLKVTRQGKLILNKQDRRAGDAGRPPEKGKIEE